MEWILDTVRILPYEAYVGIFALCGLSVLFFVRSVEAIRGSLLGGQKRLVGDEKVAEMHNKAILRGYFLVKNASALPRILAQSAIHIAALSALHGLRGIERALKRVLDAVRGKRELSTDLPPSAFIATILPKRKVPNPPKENQQFPL